MGRARLHLTLAGCVKELDFCSKSKQKALRVLESDLVCAFRSLLTLEGDKRPLGLGKKKGSSSFCRIGEG